VPGAFMSMIGHNLLSQIVMEMGETNPGKILDQLSLGVRNALKQGTHSVETRDGMDIALCVFDSDDKSLTYSGAFRPLILIRKGELTKYEGDKFSIGGLATGENQKFQSHKVDLFPGDSIYLFSDGYADQFGGQKGKKFMLKNLNNLLLSVENQPMVLREKSIRFALEEWKGDHEQVDDILVIGIKM
jgi:serine phosphatase RsbU (regulator of sigma subunit)